MEKGQILSRVRVHGRSDIGKVREENQDALLIHEPEDPQVLGSRGILVAVADGMGGLEGGKVASRLAIETLETRYYDASSGDVSAVLRVAVDEANRVIHDYSLEKGGGQPMGSTLTALAILSGYACIAQVGDSRAYRYKKGELRQITRDHSLLRELEDRGEIDRGSVLYNYHRNVLTRALGLGRSVEPDFYELGDLEEGELFLLSSDGFHELLTEAEIQDAIAEHGGDIEGLADRFVELARARGGPDNISVLLVLIGDLEARRTGSASDSLDGSLESFASPDERRGWILPLAIVLSFLGGVGLTLLLDEGSRTSPLPVESIESARRLTGDLIDDLERGEAALDAPAAVLEKVREIRRLLDPKP